MSPGDSVREHPVWVVSRSNGDKQIPLDRPRIIAILNLTPDSFSDGGRYPTPDVAARAAEIFVSEGADALDIGGESTRPGAAAVGSAEQIDRVIAALRLIRRSLGDTFPITIDTMLASVADAAIDAGADAINDISGGTADAAMLPLCARRGAGMILMHRLRPSSRDSYSDRYTTAPDYGPDGVTPTVHHFLMAQALAAIRAGVARDQIVLDPGLGFGKTVEQNLELIRQTGALAADGFPILSAVSRKSFTAAAAGLPRDTPPADRLYPTLALSVIHLSHGARLFRVHDVAAHKQGLAAAWEVLKRNGGDQPR